MLTFFRRIRKGLLGEGAISKYLLYAIGEIALVVIGILIALQINNWNTYKKEERELHTYLENIKGNLTDDLKSLDDIKTFRDSTIAQSKKWLKVANKKSISPKELMNLEYSDYAVFIDKYFQPRRSGFEALTTSGYIGKLKGTVLEQKLNNYYYVVDKIRESETSLNNTLETMENLAFDKNARQRIIKIIEAYKAEQKLSANINEEIKELVNHPNLYAANLRNAVDANLPTYYRDAEELARSINTEIENILKE